MVTRPHGRAPIIDEGRSRPRVRTRRIRLQLELNSKRRPPISLEDSDDGLELPNTAGSSEADCEASTELLRNPVRRELVDRVELNPATDGSDAESTI